MEYMKLSDSDRENKFATLKIEKELQEEEKKMFHMCNHFLQKLF